MRAPRTQRRVVVTGVGAVTPLGLSAEESWSNALEGHSGIAPITRFPTDNFGVKFAGEVKNFNSDNYIPKKEQKK
ncbi:MAG: beta-ketoacyl-[acyl-carrier-protein] synthase II, partial [Proteobacteria bacterium]|nr:beta-ketoacyl-[acyl-carrier-protein] synthase II [Pseudomonadota bacterium]